MDRPALASKAPLEVWSSVAVQGYPYQRCRRGREFPVISTLGQKPCGGGISGTPAVPAHIKTVKRCPEVKRVGAPAGPSSTRPRSQPSSHHRPIQLPLHLQQFSIHPSLSQKCFMIPQRVRRLRVLIGEFPPPVEAKNTFQPSLTRRREVRLTLVTPSRSRWSSDRSRRLKGLSRGRKPFSTAWPFWVRRDVFPRLLPLHEMSRRRHRRQFTSLQF